MKNFFKKFIRLFFPKVIICPWCGKDIMNEAPVTLYILKEKSDLKSLFAKGIIVVKQKPLVKLVGCFRDDCPSHKGQKKIPAGILKNNRFIPKKSDKNENRIASLHKDL